MRCPLLWIREINSRIPAFLIISFPIQTIQPDMHTISCFLCLVEKRIKVRFQDLISVRATIPIEWISGEEDGIEFGLLDLLDRIRSRLNTVERRCIEPHTTD